MFRELFAYKPPVTKDQFFSAGFGERKVIMCTQVLQRVRSRHRSLVDVSRSTSSRYRPNHTLPATLSASPQVCALACRYFHQSHSETFVCLLSLQLILTVITVIDFNTFTRCRTVTLRSLASVCLSSLLGSQF